MAPNWRKIGVAAVCVLLGGGPLGCGEDRGGGAGAAGVGGYGGFAGVSGTGGAAGFAGVDGVGGFAGVDSAGGVGGFAGVDSGGGVGGFAGVDGVGGDAGSGGLGGGVGGNAGVGGDAGSGGVGGDWGTEADYEDPGTGAWQRVSPDECGLDATRFADTGIANYAVFRYGKLCHMKGSDLAGAMYSSTKTLGAVMVGRAMYLTRDVPRTGPGTGTIVPEDLATDWLPRVSYNSQATLNHVMAMVGHSSNLNNLTWTYDTVGSTQINTMIQVVERAVRQLPTMGTITASNFMRQEVFNRLGMTNSTWSTSLGIASGWNGNLSDMGRLGTLLIHDGWYGGERLLSRQWVYRMSHPAFEQASTSYGQLTWLNHRGNAAGIGGNITSGANAAQGDPCAPPAFWPEYPHGLSTATSCRATVGTCDQEFDVGVFSAQGLNGQFIVMHPGLDLVITARNFSGGDGPMGLWRAVRPALVAMDPMFMGDETAFCEAYGSGRYAPDLVMPRHP